MQPTRFTAKPLNVPSARKKRSPQLVLADISIVQSLSSNGGHTPCRNGNVMYEVGIALACRQPVEVVLVREDEEKLLFDISHIPVIRFDPADEAGAVTLIQGALMDRLRERDLLKDLRLTRTLESLTQFEINLIRTNSHLPTLGWEGESLPAAAVMALPELLRKQSLNVPEDGVIGQATLSAAAAQMTPALRNRPLFVAFLILRRSPTLSTGPMSFRKGLTGSSATAGTTNGYGRTRRLKLVYCR